MTIIESKKVIVNALQQDIFVFLSDLNNYKPLFPEDRITNWESDEKKCSFRIQGTATIELIYKSSTTPSEMNLVSGDASPFPYTLAIYTKAIDGDKCEAQLIFNGKMNPMIKMMVQRPLTNLFDYVADQLVRLNK